MILRFLSLVQIKIQLQIPVMRPSFYGVVTRCYDRGADLMLMKFSKRKSLESNRQRVPTFRN